MGAPNNQIALTHHATLLRGDFDEACAALRDALQFDFQSVADPDISYIHTDALSIEEVRDLSSRALQMPVLRDYMTFIVASDTINTQAQNALLKLTEDPPTHARFIFILPHSAPLFGTLRSRFNVIDVGTATTEKGVATESFATRMKDIARMAKDKDNAGMEQLLRTAELSVHARPGSRASKALITARRYIESNGSSPKMLLENLAISEREQS